MLLTSLSFLLYGCVCSNHWLGNTCSNIDEKNTKIMLNTLKSCASKNNVIITHAQHTHTRTETQTHARIRIYKLYKNVHTHMHTRRPKRHRMHVRYMCSNSSQKCTIDISNSLVVRISNLLLFGSPFTLRNS